MTRSILDAALDTDEICELGYNGCYGLADDYTVHPDYDRLDGEVLVPACDYCAWHAAQDY